MTLPTPKRVTGLLDFVKNLNNKRLNKKFDKAEDEARKQGVDVLGLPINNTATDRALALKKYELDYSKTLKRPLHHGTTSKFETFKTNDKLNKGFQGVIKKYKEKSNPYNYPHNQNKIFTTYRKSYADWYAGTKFKDNPVPIKVLVAPKEKTKSHFWNVNYPPSEYVPNKGKPRYIYRHMRTFDEPEYLRYKPYVKGGSRKQVSHFNPKMLGITALGAGGTVSGLLSAEEMPSSDQDLSRFAPKPQHEFRQAPSSLLDKAADAYQWTADEGGWLGEFLYGGGAKALRNLGNETTPMVKTGRLPAVPTGEALLDLMEILQL